MGMMGRWNSRPLAALLLAWCWLWAAAPARAAPLDWHRTAWAAQDGPPGPVVALAQTPDGWLWVGTPAGLFRFDGVSFERIERVGDQRLPSATIKCLTAGRDGSLWIGFLYGGISRLHDGAVTSYGVADGLPRSSVMRIAVGNDGRVWAAAVQGLYRLERAGWRQVGTQRAVFDVLLDRDGGVWVRSPPQLLLQRPGQEQPTVIGPTSYDDSAVLQQAPDGTVWDANVRHGARRYRIDGTALDAESLPEGRVEAFHVARNSSIWLGQNFQLRLVPPSGAGRAIDVRETPLSGRQVYALLEDREGDIWVGTDGGLDRLRPNRLHAVELPPSGGALAIARAGPGRLWVGTSAHGLLQVDEAGQVARLPGMNTEISALASDDAGVLWVGTGAGQLWRVDGQRTTRIESPGPTPGSGLSELPVQALGLDGRRLWLSAGGLYRRAPDGTWSQWNGRGGLPDETAVVLHGGDDGCMWFGFRDDRVAVLDADDHVQVFGRADGVDVGTVMSLHVRYGRVWIGGENGVQLFTGGRFNAMRDASGEVFHGVSGIVQQRDGALWLHGVEGVVHVSAQEVQRFASTPNYRPRMERFDRRDGLQGPPSQIRPLPTSLEDEGGRLWFASGSGLASLDPRAVLRNPLPPPVEVLRLRSGNLRLPVSARMELPARTSQIALDYTALSLQVPERVRFRYRLEGVDDDWQDAGTRRTAYYGNLGPGEYHFRVTATNNDGRWNETPTMVRFSIPPAYYQTWWFKGVLALLAMGVLAMAHRVRVRQEARRAVERVRVRQTERERIAADLHDTLLQAVYGLLLRLEVVTSRITDAGTREELQSAIEMAERLAVEGRDRVAGLRLEAGRSDDLPGALRETVNQIQRNHETHIELQIAGRPREVQPTVAEELLLVAREAALNAVRHAQARRVSVTLAYRRQDLRLTVRDDGRGIEREVLERGGVEGHWGLHGMRERVEAVGGTFTLASHRGRGTTVVARLERPWTAAQNKLQTMTR
jgi:signal transduction histidine kinase/ligand-binding sensor domain-containing protein